MLYILDALSAHALCRLDYDSVVVRFQRVSAREACQHVRRAVGHGESVAILDALPPMHVEVLMQQLGITPVARPTPSRLRAGSIFLLVEVVEPEVALGAATQPPYKVRYTVGLVMRTAGTGKARDDVEEPALIPGAGPRWGPDLRRLHQPAGCRRMLQPPPGSPTGP